MTIALLELAAILVIVAINGVLAGAEIAVVSSREGRLIRRSEAGDEGAATALRLLRSPDRFLSTVQVGITAVAVASGVFGGARIAATLADLLVGLGLETELAGSLALGAVFLLLTFLVLVLGELAPKRIALRYPEELASRVSVHLARLSRLASPLVRILEASTALVLRSLPLPEPSREELVEEEIQAMIAHATASGILEAAEEEIVGQLFRLSDQTVSRIMTPREEVVWLDMGEGPEAWRGRMGEVLYTRYLVADGSLDRMLGYVKVHDLFRRCADGEPFELRSVLREPHRIPESMPAFRLLDLFQWSGDHVAVVTGAAGEVKGVVTFHDVLEGIVGEIPEDYEVEEPGMLEREDGSVLVDGLLPARELLRAFDDGGPEVGKADTVHSVLSERLGGEAGPGATVQWRGLRIEIMDMDGRRIDKVLVSR
jgi:putative hemolysin